MQVGGGGGGLLHSSPKTTTSPPNAVVHAFIYTHARERVPYRRVRVTATRFPAERHFGGCHAVRALSGEINLSTGTSARAEKLRG